MIEQVEVDHNQAAVAEDEEMIEVLLGILQAEGRK
jgi:hypothetical protein